jgi:DNA polymerase III epsilon subunit-like protein
LTLNVMLDLETLGTRPGCVILSAGMVAFTWDAIQANPFYAEIFTPSCLGAGLVIDPMTAKWWASQTEREILDRTGSASQSLSLGLVLSLIRRWFEELGPAEGIRVWGNGADFDLPILAHAFAVCGYEEPPWGPYAVRCYRTLKTLRPDIAIVRTGTHHNALNDARAQANHTMHLGHIIGVPR